MYAIIPVSDPGLIGSGDIIPYPTSPESFGSGSTTLIEVPTINWVTTVPYGTLFAQALLTDHFVKYCFGYL
jgi:hypothetical protein